MVTSPDLAKKVKALLSKPFDEAFLSFGALLLHFQCRVCDSMVWMYALVAPPFLPRHLRTVLRSRSTFEAMARRHGRQRSVRFLHLQRGMAGRFDGNADIYCISVMNVST